MIELDGVHPDEEILAQAALAGEGKGACLEGALKFLGGK